MPNPSPLDETLLSSELIYNGRIVHLYKETVRLPNGQDAQREIVHHSGAVAIVPFDADGNVLLVRQYRLAARRVLLEIPAGTLNLDEEPDACAIRELQEETGYLPVKLEKLTGIFVAPGYTTEFIHLYQASELKPSKLAQDEDEFIQVVRVSLDEAIRMIGTGEICDGKSVSGLLLAKLRR